MQFPQFAALLVAASGCVTDIWTRRIPNVLTLAGAVGGAGYYLMVAGPSGLAWSVAGGLIGALVFLPLFALRGLGGGDVKLMGALGTWVGPGDVVWLALYAALAGGLLAIVVALARGYTVRLFSNVWSMLMYWRVAGLRAHPAFTVDSAQAVRLPYAVPIAAGLVATLWLR